MKSYQACFNSVANRETPIYDVKAIDGVTHRIYQVDQSDEQEKILGIMNSMDSLFIADGHHRSAAAGVVKKNKANGKSSSYGSRKL